MGGECLPIRFPAIRNVSVCLCSRSVVDYAAFAAVGVESSYKLSACGRPMRSTAAESVEFEHHGAPAALVVTVQQTPTLVMN